MNPLMSPRFQESSCSFMMRRTLSGPDWARCEALRLNKTNKTIVFMGQFLPEVNTCCWHHIFLVPPVTQMKNFVPVLTFIVLAHFGNSQSWIWDTLLPPGKSWQGYGQGQRQK